MAGDTLPVEYLFTLTLEADLEHATVFRRGPHGTRVAAAVIGGSFEGPKLRGRVVAPGGDWVTAWANGTLQLDVRLSLVTDDDATILMQYKGISRPAGEGRSELRTAPQFETGHERYAWLNDVQAVGIGTVVGNAVSYAIYALS